MKKLLEIALLWIGMAAPALAANVNIDGLPAASSVTGADLFECEQSGINNNCTPLQLWAYFNTLAIATPGININGTINYGAGSGNSAANSSIFNTVSASGICTDPTQCTTNQFSIADNVDASAAGSGLYGWYFLDQVGAGAKKGRIGGYFEVGVSTTPAAAGQSYTALEAFSHANVNLGTASIFGINIVSQIGASASVAQVIGNETDFRALAGATYNDLIGQQNVIISTHGQAAARVNIGYTNTSQSNSTPMLATLYADGTYTGWPASNSTTSVFACIPHANAGNCPAIANGIDLSKYTSISGSAFKSAGFRVDGAGNITATSCSGCGSGGVGTPADYVSLSWYQPQHGLTVAPGSSAVTSNLIYCVFGGVPSSVTIKNLQAKVTTGSAGLASLAVYSVSGGTLTFIDSTSSALSSTTIANITGPVLNTTDIIATGALYAWCSNFNATPTMATFTTASGGALTYIGGSQANTVTGTVVIGKTIAQTFGTWPSTITLSGMADLLSTTLPQIGFQVN